MVVCVCVCVGVGAHPLRHPSSVPENPLRELFFEKDETENYFYLFIRSYVHSWKEFFRICVSVFVSE